MRAYIEPRIRFIPLANDDLIQTSGDEPTATITFDVQPNPIWDDSPDKHFE